MNPASPNPRFKIPYGYIVVAVATFNLFLFLGSQYTFGVFFKPLADEFGWQAATTSSTFSLMMLVQMVTIVMGRVNDKFGTRLVLIVSGLLQGVGYFLMARVTSLWQTYLFFGLTAIGVSGGFVPLLSAVVRAFDKRRGLMTGLASAGAAAGAMVFPPIANWLIAIYGWRECYMMLGIGMGALSVASAFLIKRKKDNDAIFTSTAPQLAASRAGYTLREALSTRRFWLWGLTIFCLGLFVNALMVHVVPHLTSIGIAAGAAATIFIAVGITNASSRVFMGAVADRLDLLTATLISYAVGVVSMVLLITASGMGGYYLFAVGFGFVFGGVSVTHSPIIAEYFGMKSHGTIFGCTSACYCLGSALGPFLLGWIYDISGSYYFGFWMMMFFALAPTVLIYILRREKQSELKLAEMKSI